MVVQWSSPPSLTQPSPSPPSSSSLSSSQLLQTTYHVYVNQEFKQAVGGVSGTMATQLSDIPRHQLVKISVRTVTEEGESPDPKKIVILNPRELFLHMGSGWTFSPSPPLPTPPLEPTLHPPHFPNTDSGIQVVNLAPVDLVVIPRPPSVIERSCTVVCVCRYSS